MKRKELLYIFIITLCIFCFTSFSLAVEVAPRISDREIVERLSRLEEGQKNLDKRINELRSEMNGRFDAIDKRFETVDKRFDDLRSEMKGRFDAMDKRLEWISALTCSRGYSGFILPSLW